MRNVVSVGYNIPGDTVESLEFKSNDSILNADIIVFAPSMSGYSGYESYAGKTLLNDADSALLREHVQHWRSELNISLQHGKTVFVIFSEAECCYYHTGRREFSGTGRSRSITDVVESFDPYSVIPMLSQPHRSRGERIRPTQNVDQLNSYWQEFDAFSYYNAYLDNLSIASLVTQTGDKAVGGIARFKELKGTLVVLPPVNFQLMVGERAEQLWKKRKGSISSATIGRAEASVGKQFVNALIQIDKAVRIQTERTPAPNWILQGEFALQEEVVFEKELASIEQKIVELQNARLVATRKLEEAGNLKSLLYETGVPLESSLLEALRLLGFQAENYRDSESEFDVLFVDTEGNRLLGEAEGKTDKAINIEKLDQLNRNVQEEFAKRPGAKYSKGVLFGNAFRLIRLEERGEFFTEKSLQGRSDLVLLL